MIFSSFCRTIQDLQNEIFTVTYIVYHTGVILQILQFLNWKKYDFDFNGMPLKSRVYGNELQERVFWTFVLIFIKRRTDRIIVFLMFLCKILLILDAGFEWYSKPVSKSNLSPKNIFGIQDYRIIEYSLYYVLWLVFY